MKPRIMSWVSLLCAGALGACSGEVSTIGTGQEPGKGGESSTPEGKGGASVVPGTGGASMGGKEPTGGASMAGKDPGMGGAVQVECARDMECAVDLKCEKCADGSEACSKSYCAAGGKCVRQEAVCSDRIKCETPMDCPVLDVPCKDCGNGEKACPTAQCVMGFCQESLGVCENPPDACKTTVDCGPQDANCVLCDDGSCAKTDCVNGTCQQSCPSTGQSCKQVTDCAVVGDVCFKCPTTGQCAVQACVQYSCQMVCPVP